MSVEDLMNAIGSTSVEEIDAEIQRIEAEIQVFTEPLIVRRTKLREARKVLMRQVADAERQKLLSDETCSSEDLSPPVSPLDKVARYFHDRENREATLMEVVKGSGVTVSKAKQVMCGETKDKFEHRKCENTATSLFRWKGYAGIAADIVEKANAARAVSLPMIDKIVAFMSVNGPSKVAFIAEQIGQEYQQVYNCIIHNGGCFEKIGKAEFKLKGSR